MNLLLSIKRFWILPVPFLFFLAKAADPGPVFGMLPFYGPVWPSCYISRYLLHASEAVLRDTEAPCNDRYAWTILEDLGYLCSLIGLLVLPVGPYQNTILETN